MMHYTHTYNSNKGFSLVETLVAIAILLIVIVGPMSIATNAANSTSFANQQIMAYFLAQEGLELAQKGRDDFLLASFDAGNAEGSDVAWDDFTAGSVFDDCFSANGCGLEIDETTDGEVLVNECDPITECRLYITDDTSQRSRYSYDSSLSGATASDFTRIITMDTSGDEVLVTSEVRWRSGNQIAVQSTTATTYLYNIYGR